MRQNNKNNLILLKFESTVGSRCYFVWLNLKLTSCIVTATLKSPAWGNGLILGFLDKYFIEYSVKYSISVYFKEYTLWTHFISAQRITNLQKCENWGRTPLGCNFDIQNVTKKYSYNKELILNVQYRYFRFPKLLQEILGCSNIYDLVNTE